MTMKNNLPKRIQIWAEAEAKKMFPYDEGLYFIFGMEMLYEKLLADGELIHRRMPSKTPTNETHPPHEDDESW